MSASTVGIKLPASHLIHHNSSRTDLASLDFARVCHNLLIVFNSLLIPLDLVRLVGAVSALVLDPDVAGGAVAADSLLDVLGLELSVLVVAVRLLDRVGDGIEDVGGFLEDGVHFLERSVPGLGEEEVHDGKHESVAARC